MILKYSTKVTSQVRLADDMRHVFFMIIVPLYRYDKGHPAGWQPSFPAGIGKAIFPKKNYETHTRTL
jgi:hypothetical protein